MRKLLTSKVFWGLALVIGGGILLLESLGVIEGSEPFWMVVLGIAGVLFLVALITNHEAWWAVIPGISLLAVALGLALDTFAKVSGEILGVVILGGIGLSFLIVYLIRQVNWWAIIPAGALITLAIVAGIESSSRDMLSGAIFFAGLGLTFALVALLPNRIGRMTWAWIPAGILLVLAIIVLADIASNVNYIWPVVIILAGGFFIWRAFKGHRG